MSIIKFFAKAVLSFLAFIVAIIILLALVMPSDEQVQEGVNDLYNQVAVDAEQQYAIVQTGGDLIEICVHAGMVAAAYVQANDQENYQRWKAIEDEDCRNAGMPNY